MRRLRAGLPDAQGAAQSDLGQAGLDEALRRGRRRGGARRAALHRPRRGEPPRYRSHLGCILRMMPAMSLSTGGLCSRVAADRPAEGGARHDLHDAADALHG